MKTERDENGRIPRHTAEECKINEVKDLTPADDEQCGHHYEGDGHGPAHDKIAPDHPTIAHPETPAADGPGRKN